MRTTQRDKRTIYYALYTGTTDVTDSNGNLTGEKVLSYSAPVKTRMNVSRNFGESMIEPFGIGEQFTHTLVTDDLITNFDTDTIWWFGVTPGDTADAVPHNFRCTRVARTINQVAIYLIEVDVSHENNTHPIVSG